MPRVVVRWRVRYIKEMAKGIQKASRQQGSLEITWQYAGVNIFSLLSVSKGCISIIYHQVITQRSGRHRGKFRCSSPHQPNKSPHLLRMWAERWTMWM